MKIHNFPGKMDDNIKKLHNYMEVNAIRGHRKGSQKN